MAKINYITDRNLFDDFDNDLITCILYQEDTDFKRDRVLVKDGFAKALYQRYPKVHERIASWFDNVEHLPKSQINNNILGNELETIFDTQLEYPLKKYIFTLFVQEHKGAPELLDNIFARGRRLEKLLYKLNMSVNFSNFKIGIPLIGSGNAADPDIKRIHGYDNLKYFKEIIVPILKNSLKNLEINVYC